MTKEKIYSDDFYKGQIDDSLKSARLYASHLTNLIDINSVVDFGCGRGAWLKAFHELGASDLVGYDGSWNTKEQMLIEEIKFTPADLNSPIKQERKFDLAMSLEVAEHLLPESADNIVNNLVKSSNLVMFGAAYEGQGGTDHLNEQPPSYWAKKFMAHDYLGFDIFRPSLWGNKDICFWYRQNTYIYVKKDSDCFVKLIEGGLSPVESIDFLDCIHPELYHLAVSREKLGRKFRDKIRPLIPKSLLSCIYYLRRAS